MNDENVVKPPQKPTVRNKRRFVLSRLPRSNNPYNIPMMKQPNTFIINVPNGKDAECRPRICGRK
jgi:hypothetical protein